MCSCGPGWATFIANRTSQIQDLTSPDMWRHVTTQNNPVDCASRGLFPSELINHSLWWTGPLFLKNPSEQWPTLPGLQEEKVDSTPIYELRKSTVLLINIKSTITDLLSRFSSLNKILRIIAYCLRLSKPRPSALSSIIIDSAEFSRALSALIYFTQQTVYANEISRLNKKIPCSKVLRRLCPFIDETGLVRVGGRITNADIPYKQKHPLLLSVRHQLTNLIIDHHHHRLKHPGSNALQAYLQREYWIQSARRAIRSRLRLCMSCFRIRPKCVQPKMADLPIYRVQQIKPFAISGVDYAGPISLKGPRRRLFVSTSAYICLFVCTATKAIHLELSSDLSIETFLLAFTRFSARRGPIKEMHSDCGTNFVGASHLLTPLQKLIHSDSYQDQVRQHLSKLQTSWHFNLPSSPHFGGLWEAGIKSTKTLMLRSIGTHKLTGEELLTLLTQIEATLNSRPLGVLINDPTDLEALTPSHFLTLEPSTSIPDPTLEAIPLSKLQRWRLITDHHRHFWSRWKNEYITSLQIRTKWTTDGQPLNTGDLVLIKEASTHPLYWPLGRIQQLHPGPDGVPRIATVKTPTSVLIRPAIKLCPLPFC